MKSLQPTISEDYPINWNKDEFKKIRSFNGKLRYANDRLEKIASGSGRTVFKIDDQRALKIAKNKKGLAQNGVESERFLQTYDVIAKVFDSDPEDINDIGPFWVEMELAKKLTKKRFETITGVKIDMLGFYLKKNFGRGKYRFSPKEQSYFDMMDENEFVIEMMSLVGDYDMGIGDLDRVSSYGEVVRDGSPAVVLVDFGLTNRVWDDFYAVR